MNSDDLKQAICHQILGCTHRDIERSMLAVINEKQLTEEEAALVELEELAPEKFNPDIQFKVNKEKSNVKRDIRYRNLTREETAVLIAASSITIKAPPLLSPILDYPTYTREDVQALMRGDYDGYKHLDKKRGKNGNE